jgi:hypothetical protein
MKPITILGIALAVLGVLALVYQGFSYTRQKDVLDIRTDTRHSRHSGTRLSSAHRRRAGFGIGGNLDRHGCQAEAVAGPQPTKLFWQGFRASRS